MKDIKAVAENLKDLLGEKNINKYAISVSNSTRKELSWDNGKFSLFRTVMGNSLAIRGFKNNKTGSVAGTDFSNEGLKLLVSDLELSIDSSVEDKDHDIAEKQENKVFRKGDLNDNMELLLKRLSEFVDEVSTCYPEIQIMNLTGNHTKFHSIYFNSNKTNFEKEASYYNFGVEFSASKGEISTGFSSADLSTFNLDKPFIETGMIRKQLEDCVSALNRVEIEDKFTGTVIMTPSCFAEFLYMVSSIFLTDSSILDGTSLWLNKIGEKVANDNLTVSLKVSDPRIIDADEWTGDGYLSEDINIIENGKLKTHLIGLYTANKTGKKVTKNADFSVVIESGKKSLDEMISGVKEGLLVGSFSGGHPNANGEFSGVAKNSFYIKDGKIQGAVLETMINGNLSTLLMDLLDLSLESQCRGSYVLPYASFSNIVVTSK